MILFGIPNERMREASGAYAEKGVVQEAVRAIKAACPELLVITDVCLCEYTSHGHCGVTRIDEGTFSCPQRRKRGPARESGSFARGGRRRHRRPERHDGRTGGRDSRKRSMPPATNKPQS